MEAGALGTVQTHCAGALQCANVHILMIDRGQLDQACQLTAAAVINKQSQVILDVMTAIIDDKVACPPLHPSIGSLLQQGLQQDPWSPSQPQLAGGVSVKCYRAGAASCSAVHNSLNFLDASLRMLVESLRQGCAPQHKLNNLVCGRLVSALPLMQDRADAVARKALCLPQTGHKAVMPPMALQDKGYAGSPAPLSQLQSFACHAGPSGCSRQEGAAPAGDRAQGAGGGAEQCANQGGQI